MSEARSGIAAVRQSTAMSLIRRAGTYGVTVAELRRALRLHHGQASSVLSTLHKEGRIQRLTERRDRCQVYVSPAYVMGRETVPHGRNRKTDMDALYEAFKGAALIYSPDMENDATILVVFEKWLRERQTQ